MAALEGLVRIDAAVSPAWLGVTLVCFGIATFGALCASCLAVYSPTKLQNRIQGPAADLLLSELERRERELRVVARFYFLIGLLGALLALRSAVDAETQPWAIAVLGALALFFCGSLPAAVADARAEATLLRALPVLRGGLAVLRWPLVLPVLAVTGGMLRVLRIREEPSQDPEVIAEEVMAAVADSVAEDRLAQDERAWIGNIVGLVDLQVSTIMTPRPDVVAIKAGTPLREAVRLALQHGFSRYPVYRERVDDVSGIFVVKDALRLLHDAADAQKPVETMMRTPLFVPESMGVVQLLRRFQADKVHMAIVLDEYGTTAGVVSVEDVLEQIVGDIADEYDAADSSAGEQIAVVEAGRVVDVPGRTPVEKVNELLGTELPEDGDFETIAGLVIHHTNRIPAPDDQIQVDGVEFRVLQADDRRIGRLRVTAPSPETADQDA
jgi:putative hemolysin